jgi:glycosyltransferase involved in cell wall biosynthesis
MTSIYAVRTLYPHWGRFTGPHRVLGHLNPERFTVRQKKVPMGSPLKKADRLKRLFRQRIADNPGSVYGPHDFLAEASLFFRCLFSPPHIVHLFDAEHSLRFLTGWFNKFGRLRSFPPIVAMFHQPPFLLESMLDRAAVEPADCILVVSPDQRDYFRRLFPGKRVELILLGVEAGHFTPRPGIGDGETFKCLAGGVWLRDYQALFATAGILAERPEFEFHIVAPPHQIPEAPPNIKLHSGISDRAFLELYRTSDVLFMPLKASTANNVLLEAISCGLPVVTTDLASVRAYLPGEEAVLIKGNDPGAFAETLLALHRDPEKRARMSRSARRRALELSWEVLADQYAVLYNSLLKEAAGRPGRRGHG